MAKAFPTFNWATWLKLVNDLLAALGINLAVADKKVLSAHGKTVTCGPDCPCDKDACACVLTSLTTKAAAKSAALMIGDPSADIDCVITDLTDALTAAVAYKQCLPPA